MSSISSSPSSPCWNDYLTNIASMQLSNRSCLGTWRRRERAINVFDIEFTFFNVLQRLFDEYSIDVALESFMFRNLEVSGHRERALPYIPDISLHHLDTTSRLGRLVSLIPPFRKYVLQPINYFYSVLWEETFHNCSHFIVIGRRLESTRPSISSIAIYTTLLATAPERILSSQQFFSFVWFHYNPIGQCLQSRDVKLVANVCDCHDTSQLEHATSDLS